MNSLYVTYNRKGKPSESWTVTGIDTPVKWVNVTHAPVEQNILQVAVHEDALKILRLKELRAWKKRWKLTKICGYNGNVEDYVKIVLPPSWEGFQPRPMLYWFLRILLDEAWKEF